LRLGSAPRTAALYGGSCRDARCIAPKVISPTQERRRSLYLLGGPADIAEANGLDDFEQIHKVPVFVGDQPGAGHGGLISVPNAEGTKIELDWLDWQFNHDPIAARTFIGPHCELCRDFRWHVHRKGI
jgi:hypothetical protein